MGTRDASVQAGAQAGQMPTERQFGALADAVAYLAASVGLPVAILAASQWTLLGVALVVGATLGWTLLFRHLTRADVSERGLYIISLGLAVCALLPGLAVFQGMYFDWLLAVTTVTVFAIAYPPRVSLALGLALFAAVVLSLASFDLPDGLGAFVRDAVMLLSAFTFAFSFALLLRHSHHQREQAEQLVRELEATQAQLRAYAEQAEELAVSRERNRLAREIHDTLGHYLTILAVQLETALKLEERGDPHLHTGLVEARRMASECLAEVRRSVATLRPADPTARSLTDALAALTDDFEAAQPATEVVLDVEGPTQALPTDIRIALYRAVQEALTNVRKHAQATKVLVRLRVSERCAELTVLDNGVGHASGQPASEGGFGLLGMRERFALLNGTVAAQPDPIQGWRVEITVPLPPPTQEAPETPETPTPATPAALAAAEG